MRLRGNWSVKQTAAQSDEEVAAGKGLIPHFPSLSHTPAKIQFQFADCTPVIEDKPLPELGVGVRACGGQRASVLLGGVLTASRTRVSSEEGFQLIPRKHISGSIFYWEFQEKSFLTGNVKQKRTAKSRSLRSGARPMLDLKRVISSSQPDLQGLCFLIC